MLITSVPIKKYRKLKTKYNEIKEERDFFKRGYYEIKEELKDSQDEFTKLKGRMAQHDNPHTPSSQKPIGQKNNRSGRRDKPRRPSQASQRNPVRKKDMWEPPAVPNPHS